jgi:hypothetical protein
MFSCLNVLFGGSRKIIFLLILAVFIPTIASAAPKDRSRWDKHFDVGGFLF